MSRIAIVQARMTSARLPGKSTMMLGDRPMLTHVVERARAVPGIDEVWIATTDDGTEAPLVALADSLGVPAFRGLMNDVLSRYAAIARQTGATTIMRLTADCPLLDPKVSGEVLSLFEGASPGCDYASNTLERTFPRGLDTEVFSAAALRAADAEATDPLDREHVTRFIYRRPKRYRLLNHAASVDRSHLRWTVDTPEDFTFMAQVHREIVARGLGYSLRDTLSVLEALPELSAINAHIEQKTS